MTGTYEWNPMPHVLDVRCPGCGEAARFEFAEVVRIRLRDEIAFFQQSQQFDYHFLSGTCGNWHGAFYFQGLHGPPASVIRNLPRGYASSDWGRPKD